jgi:hypothetical protein
MTRPSVLNRSTAFSSSGEVVYLDNEVRVDQLNYKTTLANIDPTKQYRFDGIVDMSADPITIVIPAGGHSFRGLNFDVSGIKCTADNFTLFQSAGGGSGNVLGADCFIEVSGTNSKVWDIFDVNGFNACEFSQVNYINPSSLGIISGYRQGLEVGTGRFGGSPELTLDGTWIGGYRFDISVAGNMSAGFTGSLFKAGPTFVMNSRFVCNINMNLPTLASVLDFSPANFPNSNTLLLQDMRVTRNGVINANDANLTPNIDHASLKSNWKNNVGLNNTFKGASLTITSEVATVITTVGVGVTLAGTQLAGNLEHFDSPSNGRMRFLSDSTKDYRATYDYVLESAQGNIVRIDVVIDRAAGGTEIISTQKRVVNNLQGSRDVAYCNRSFSFELFTNDEIYVQVANETSTANITAEIDSFILVEER